MALRQRSTRVIAPVPVTSARAARSRVSLFLGSLVLAAALGTSVAHAQGWWPWSNQQEAPRPREPVFRQPPPAPGQTAPAPGQIARPPGAAGNNICLQLEQRLVAEGQKGAGGREALTRIETEMRQVERDLQRAQAQVDRADCYDTFLFVKSLRNTPSCRNAAGQVDGLRRKMADLDGQRRQIMGSGERSYQDEIIRELARNGCGQQYVQEARRRDSQGTFGSIFSSEEDGGPRTGNQFGSLPFATYRTICVRLCDGYYFPVSFSTLPNHFARDQDICQQKCVAPVELYYHQNPGGGVEQAISAKSQQPYSQLRTAFRYRKELVNGCSCKEAEYQPQPGERRADGSSSPPGATAVPRQQSSQSR